MANIDLPEDVTVKILLRLPIEDLIRWSCVSKRWCSVVLSDIQFAKSHYTLASQRRALGRRLLVLDFPQFKSLDLQTPLFGDESSVRKLTYPFKPPVRIVGSSNGLVCLSLGWFDNINIWNPSTGFFQRLPAPVPVFPPEKDRTSIFGFGYCSVLEDYKVFVATDSLANLTLDPAKEVERFSVRIFSVRSQLWTKKEILLGQCITGMGALVNGALHWLDIISFSIVAFDLATDEVRELPRPALVGEERVLRLGVSSEGFLYMTIYAPNVYDCCFSVWVMREYGVPSSWTKLCYINHSELSSAHVVSETSVVLGIWRWNNGNCKIMRKVDHENGSLGEYSLPKLSESECIEYEESLLRVSE